MAVTMMPLERCRVMGILNVTPDSFSDGGKFADPEKAVARAFEMAEEGADLIDVGGESTRPGSGGVDAATERARLEPVLAQLRDRKFPLPISLDTSKPEIARWALEERLAQIVNDVAGLRDPEMAEVIRAFRVPVVLMHMHGTPRTMQTDYRYDDVVSDLIRFFRSRLDETGLAENAVLDPGIGFGKSVEQNCAILRRLREFEVLGRPLLVGVSRKSFLGKILGREPGERLEGSLVAAVVAAQNGASIVRVHDVAPTVAALRVSEAIRKA